MAGGHDVRRFPLPWTIDGNESAYWVRDAEGKRFGFTYYDERPTIGTGVYGGKLTRAEALVIVRNIAKLPELLKRRAEKCPSSTPGEHMV